MLRGEEHAPHSLNTTLIMTQGPSLLVEGRAILRTHFGNSDQGMRSSLLSAHREFIVFLNDKVKLAT